MKLIFRIQYRTIWGENLVVLIDNENGTAQEISLSTANGNDWQGECVIPDEERRTAVNYRYAIYRNKQCTRKELSPMPHTVYMGNKQQQIYIIDDCWRDVPHDNYRYSSAFGGFYTTEPANVLADSVGSCIVFRAVCPGLDKKQQRLGISGSCDALGRWEACRPLRMHEVQPNVWQLAIDSSTLRSPFEYKFVAINEETGAIEAWEAGNNRIFNIQPLMRGETYLPMETEVSFQSKPCRIAGTAIPVFSLRSEGSFGTGDFGDLKKLIEWAIMTKQKAVQILPINDTTMSHTWMDSYPYNSISIYAFHPMYIDVRQLPQLKDTARRKYYEEERQKLNKLPQLDYEGVNNVKRAYLKEIYVQEGEAILASEEFKEFYNKNKEWLIPYAAYSFLRDKFHTSDFNNWREYSKYDPELIQTLCNEKSADYKEIAFHLFIQFELHVQLLKACNYGREKGVLVKGDIPIGISRTSVEAWIEPQYFNMNGQAGAPPDAFSTNGQNWGMPTYNWMVMQKDNYRWWQKRFKKMAEYFTAYRIDHILGFFRIWEIPIHSVHGLLGQFVPSIPMSEEEIRSFGLNFREDFLQPYINDYILNTQFGDDLEYVKETFVRHLHHDLYAIRPEFNTQRKIEAYFAGKDDEHSLSLKEKLYALVSDVLFVPDHSRPGMYHPRIAVQNDYTFLRLHEKEKDAFNNLYNHYYYQRHNDFWYGEAMKKLPILTQATQMLVCGEDLGMVPDCVPWVMNQLQILSLEIQRMPKQTGLEFGRLDQYLYLSVCTIGTHDMSTLRGWWKEDPAQTERYYHNELGHWGEVPSVAPGWVCEEVVRRHLEYPSMLCILTWQDWLSMDEKMRNPDIQAERINIPANPHHYWRWRMHITLEQLMELDSLNKKIENMITESGRD